MKTAARFGMCACGLALLFVIEANPFGWGVRLFDGQRPPYHWEFAEMSKYSLGSVDLSYVGSNDAVCARVYRYALVRAEYTVFGFGFSGEYATEAEARRKAERECR